MPGFDGRGPWGRGPMTGWGRGYCAGPGYGARGGGYGAGWGRGYGWGNRAGGYGAGWGYGRGFGPAWWAAPETIGSRDDELAYLQNRAGAVQEELAEIRRRIDQLNKGEETER